VALLGRTSTLALQDPLASMQRQVRKAREWLPEGWRITGYYWDIESGGIDLESRSQTGTWEEFAAAGIPRDGGVTDLLHAAASPNPPFSIVVVEDIERSARDTFNSLKIERELQNQGILLFATDEPFDVKGISPTAILVRRVKQGVAE
jgi:DNA invertase Pin-like site-specific DNA recombinase